MLIFPTLKFCLKWHTTQGHFEWQAGVAMWVQATRSHPRSEDMDVWRMPLPLLFWHGGVAHVLSGLKNLGSLGPFGLQLRKTWACEKEEGWVFFPARLGETQHFSEALDDGAGVSGYLL